MNRKSLITSIIAFVAVIAIAVTAVLVSVGGDAPLVNDPAGNNEVLLSEGKAESSVDTGVDADAEYLLAVSEGVNLQNIASKVLVTDYDGNAVTVSFTANEDGTYSIVAPIGGYIPGAAYSITLGKGVSFADEDMAASSTWDFIVDKPATETVEYQDNVVSLSAGTFEMVSDSAITSISDFAAGTIIIVPVDGAYEAYKVTGSSAVTGGYSLNVEEPTMDEVFKDIDISGSFTVLDGEFSINTDVLLAQLQNSELVLGLGFSMPSISLPRAEIDQETGLVYLDIQFVFSNLIPDVESSITIRLNNVIDIAPFVNYSTVPFSFNIGADMKVETTTTYSVSVGYSYSGSYNVEDLIAELGDLTKQTISENFLRVFSWSYPIANTGLIISYDLDLVVRISFAGTLTATTVNYSDYTLGVYYVDKELKSFCNKNAGSFELDSLALVGEVGAQAGLLNTLSLSFLQIAKVALKLEVGLYADIYGAVQFNLDNILESQGGYFLDSGVYYDLSIEAGVEILGFGTSQSFDLIGDKISLYQAGSRILVVDYAVDAEDGAIDEIVVSSKDTLIPNLIVKQYDLVTHTFSYVSVSSDKSVFTIEGTDNVSIADGVITIADDADASFSDAVLVQYKGQDTVTHTIMVTKDSNLPYVTGNAIQSFDKSNPGDLVFTLDLKGASFSGITAAGFKSNSLYYSYASGTLTLKEYYLLRCANGTLKVDIATSANTLSVWINIDGTVSLYASGAGTLNNPYLIYTVDQLRELAAASANIDLSGYYFRLSSNIDMRGEEFAPIPDFKGVFDGYGYTISNFVITSLGDGYAAGLFAKVSGTVKNLTVDGTLELNGEREVNAGLIAGINNGTIENCTVKGSVSVVCETGNLNRTFFKVGGAVGLNNGTLLNITAEDTVYVKSSSYNVLTETNTAGIAGVSSGTITGCTADIDNVTDDSAWYNGSNVAEISN